MIRSNKGRFVILALATASLVLATTSAGWRDAFAAVTYGGTTNYLACSNQANPANLVVTIAQGPALSLGNYVGSACESVLNALPPTCKIDVETQGVKSSKFSSLMRINCQ